MMTMNTEKIDKFREKANKMALTATVFVILSLFIIFPDSSDESTGPKLVFVECGNDICEPVEEENCPADCGGVGGITQLECTDAGGHWNTCGSICAGISEEFMCSSVCSEQCECGGLDMLRGPDDHICRLSGESELEIGVCI